MNKLAVIVLNYNDANSTKKYVSKIKDYDCIDRIIVVDNMSPDGSYKKLKKLNDNKVDVIVSDGNKGYAYGNNYAIRYLNEKYGKYEYIAISNPDVEVPEESYKKCIDFLSNNEEVAIAAPRMYDINNNPHPLSGWKLRSLRGDIIDSSLLLTEIFRKSHMERYPSNYFNKKNSYVDCVAGSFFIIKHSIFESVGYFDENTFLYFEEDILGNKIKKLGYKNVILNSCAFKHYESVSVDKSINSMKKFKILQESKKYYHSTYDPVCNTKSKHWKIWILEFFTHFRKVEEGCLPMIKKLKIDKIFRKIREIFSREFLVKIVKLLLLIVHIIILPISFVMKKCRKREKVLYFSLVTWNWIKQRPHFVALELVEQNYNVDYRYQELYKKYMPKDDNKNVKNEINTQKYFHIKPFRILPANKRFRILFNSIWSVIRTSFWNYDKIILTHPNQIDFFFMRVQKLKGTQVFYECMDNYEGWEINKEGFIDKQSRLIGCSKHVIVTADKLKKKIEKIYNCEGKVTVIRNGYDDHLFKNYKKVKTNLKHPNIAYIGTIDDWFDFDSVFQFARNNENFNIDIIGPVNDSVKNIIDNMDSKNIKFHGPIEHNLVPQYIEDSDVLIMPFIINDIIEYVDPVKLYEYLYMKKPVVTTYWKELDQFKNMVSFYDGPKQFEKNIKQAIQRPFKETKEYKKLIHDSKWSERLKEYINIIQRKR